MIVGHSELNQPRRDRGLEYLSKRAYSAVNVNGRTPRGNSENRVVENVENIHAELEVISLSDGEALHEREIPILLVRPAESIARCCTPSSSSWIAGKARRWDYRRSPEASGIQVVRYFVRSRPLGVG